MRSSIRLIELLALPALVVPVLLAREQLFLQQDWDGIRYNWYLDTRQGVALLVPFTHVPFFCLLAYKNLHTLSVGTLGKNLLPIIVGFLIGGGFGLMLSVPAYCAQDPILGGDTEAFFCCFAFEI
ncbi:MAG: hypothetical protein AAF623_13270 [Planctomycetota bacterium]